MQQRRRKEAPQLPLADQRVDLGPQRDQIIVAQKVLAGHLQYENDDRHAQDDVGDDRSHLRDAHLHLPRLHLTDFHRPLRTAGRRSGVRKAAGS